MQIIDNDLNHLVIHKQTDKIHRWKTWEPKSPFAPYVDAHVFCDEYDSLLAKEIRVIANQSYLGQIEESKFLSAANWKSLWTKYNLFTWSHSVFKILRDRIYDSYDEYCKGVDIKPLDRKDIWIRGWLARVESGQSIGMHSHALHENAFVSGNMSLHSLNPYTTTDYWIPLFSLYHGYFQVKNEPGVVTLFPSWLQHRVDTNQSSKVRYTLAFDLFNEYNFKYIRKTETSDTDLAKIILLSTKL